MLHANKGKNPAVAQAGKTFRRCSCRQHRRPFPSVVSCLAAGRRLVMEACSCLSDALVENLSTHKHMLHLLDHLCQQVANKGNCFSSPDWRIQVQAETYEWQACSETLRSWQTVSYSQRSPKYCVCMSLASCTVACCM